MHKAKTLLKAVEAADCSLQLVKAWKTRADVRLTLQGRPLITRNPFLRTVPACWGYVREAPASALSKCTSCCSSAMLELVSMEPSTMSWELIDARWRAAKWLPASHSSQHRQPALKA